VSPFWSIRQVCAARDRRISGRSAAGTGSRNGVRGMNRPLPQDIEAERELLSCVLAWPDRATGIIRLVRADDFVDELHAKVWRLFATQLDLTGEVDIVAAARELQCAEYLLELTLKASTSTVAPIMADSVKDTAKARDVIRVCERGIATM